MEEFYLEYGDLEISGEFLFCTDKNGNRHPVAATTRHATHCYPCRKTVTKVGGGDASVSSGRGVCRETA